MNDLNKININQDEIFNNLQVDKIKTNKLEYNYVNNIVYIDVNNCNNLVLNENDTSNFIITKDNNLDINIIWALELLVQIIKY